MDPLALPKQVLLYAIPPFFAHPFKPLLNVLIGSPYDKAFEHFMADHQTPFNLILHMMCLCFQLLANFTFLSEMDDKLDSFLSPKSSKQTKRQSTGWLVNGTAVVWSLYLLFNSMIEESMGTPSHPPPLSVISAACLLIAIASQLGPLLRPYWMVLIGLESFIVGLAIEALVLKHTSAFGSGFFIAVAVHLLIWVLLSSYGRGALKAYKHIVISCYLLLIVLVCTKSDPVASVVLLGAFLSWPLAILCDEPALVFYGMGYLATASQGVAHHLSGEAATLIRLNEEAAANSDLTQALVMQAAKVCYEWSHVTNFPTLALHACAKRTSASPIPIVTNGLPRAIT